jgi:S1-C subfamily serine protease
MEKLVISSQDLAQGAVFDTVGPGDFKTRSSVPWGVRVTLIFLAFVLPVLCLATIVIWVVVRHKSVEIRYVWLQACCLPLAISGLLTSFFSPFTFLVFDNSSSIPSPEARQVKTTKEFPLDALNSFPAWPSDKTLAPKELATALDSMVFIVARDEQWRHPTPEIVAMSGFGSGALLFADEKEFLVATNRHVIDGEGWQRGRSYSGNVILGTRSGDFGQAQIVGRHKRLDLLLLRVERHHGDQRFTQPLQDFERIDIGERIVIFGHPQGLFFSLADGLVSRTDGRDTIQISSPVSPGNSGGPVFDFRGRLLGIVTAMWDKNAGVAENLNFATRSDALLRSEDWNLTRSGSNLLERYIAAARAIPNPPDL